MKASKAIDREGLLGHSWRRRINPDPMLTVQAYLQSPKTRRVLSTKPGDEGFSLIELVVVVAVLAILAAIAIPAFTSINDKAAVSAAQNTVAQIVKECAVKKANMETEAFNIPKLNSYELTSATTNVGGVAKGNCAGTSDKITVEKLATVTNTKLPTPISIDVTTGEKTCTAGAGDTQNAFCAADGKW